VIIYTQYEDNEVEHHTKSRPIINFSFTWISENVTLKSFFLNNLMFCFVLIIFVFTFSMSSINFWLFLLFSASVIYFAQANIIVLLLPYNIDGVLLLIIL
jgi:hypothetical protein